MYVPNKPVGPNSAAFPYDATGDTGLTKREYFAAMAMQGFIGVNIKSTNVKDGDQATRLLADMAVLMADALIASLNCDRFKEGK